MDEFCYVDSQNLGPEGKKNQIARKRLSDITNTQSHHKSLNQDEKFRPYSFATKEYIEKLQKENVTLRQLLQESTHVLQERNKLIELTGIELTKMRINFQKLQQQNRLLAQTNSQMTMERTLDKDRLRVMQHEIGCRGALLAVKDTECQMEEVKKKRLPKACMVKKPEEVAGEAVEDGGTNSANDKSNKIEEEPIPAQCADTKSNRSRRSRIQLSESSAMKEQLSTNEKPQDKSNKIEDEPIPDQCAETKSNRSRRSRIQSSESSAMKEQLSTNEKPQDKRQSLRRQSSRFSCEKAVVPPVEERNDATKQSEGEEEQLEVKRKPIGVKSGSQEATDSKRQSLRSQSSRFSCEKTVVPPLEERNDVSKQSDGEEEQVEVKRSCSQSQSKSEQPIEEKIDAATTIRESCSEEGYNTPSGEGGLRTSIGGSSRPLRRAVGKVQTYKEIPLNKKMRRSE